jgi:hypothetical protein
MARAEHVDVLQQAVVAASQNEMRILDIVLKTYKRCTDGHILRS